MPKKQVIWQSLSVSLSVPVCLSVCLFVCSSAGLLQHLWTDFDRILWRCWAWHKEELISGNPESCGLCLVIEDSVPWGYRPQTDNFAVYFGKLWTDFDDILQMVREWPKEQPLRFLWQSILWPRSEFLDPDLGEIFGVVGDIWVTVIGSVVLVAPLLLVVCYLWWLVVYHMW